MDPLSRRDLDPLQTNVLPEKDNKIPLQIAFGVDLIAVAPQSRHNVRSRNATLLVSANARCLPTPGDRAFQSAAPKLWNSLPVEIRNIQTLTSF